MFDTFSSSRQSVKINAVSGTMVKNYKDSFMLRFHMKSSMADGIFDIHPHINTNYEGSKRVVVLQIMLCGDQEFLAEVMWKDDFDKMFEIESDT